MKYIYTVLIALLVFTSGLQAQVTVYHENMSDPVVGVYSGAAGEWTFDNQVPGNTLQASGGRYIATTTAQKTDGMRAKAAYLYNDISTIGYESLILTWIDYRSFLNNGNSGTMNGNPVKLYYSVNKGANYIEVTGLNEAITFNKWVQKSVKLPIACNNVQDIRLVWVISNDNKHGDYYAIDDITLTGTPEEGISTLDWNKVAKNEDPFAAGKSYTVDGKVVFLISQFQQALSYRHA